MITRYIYIEYLPGGRVYFSLSLDSFAFNVVTAFLEGVGWTLGILREVHIKGGVGDT